MLTSNRHELDNWVNRRPWHRYDASIASLASTLLPEKWSYDGRADYRILSNYIIYTFDKLRNEYSEAPEAERPKILYEGAEKACFNTGLFDKNWQPIFFYCIRNRTPDKQPWDFQSFQTAYTLNKLGINGAELRRADYFSNPSDLVFDFRCAIIPQWDHILDEEENFRRIPENIRTLGKDACQYLITGSIERTIQRIRANYKTVIPQWFKGRIQLLIPLYLTNGDKPDLALAISKNETTMQYLGHTCLTCEMAYNNARLIARPESYWLDP
ncbi:MAG: DUF3825 domain-containing protein [Defluviitaleaceae bacterium]|nr:DUF3825 domain-containing protein [Defluviitaleaceae bacterium]